MEYKVKIVVATGKETWENAADISDALERVVDYGKACREQEEEEPDIPLFPIEWSVAPSCAKTAIVHGTIERKAFGELKSAEPADFLKAKIEEILWSDGDFELIDEEERTALIDRIADTTRSTGGEEWSDTTIHLALVNEIVDLLKKPEKTEPTPKDKLGEFIGWIFSENIGWDGLPEDKKEAWKRVIVERVWARHGADWDPVTVISGLFSEILFIAMDHCAEKQEIIAKAMASVLAVCIKQGGII